MSRYIDADKIPFFIGVDAETDEEIMLVTMTQIEELPTADMVEVVRCKDCKYCFHYIRPNYERYECEYYGSSDEVVDYVEAMHYCSYGERRGDNE